MPTTRHPSYRKRGLEPACGILYGLIAGAVAWALMYALARVVGL